MKENSLKKLLTIENRTKYFVHLLTFFCISSIVIFLVLVAGTPNLRPVQRAVAQEKISEFEGIELLAKSAVVWDVVNQRELFAKNPDLPLPLASLTKVMTALTAQITLSEEATIQIKEEYLKPEGDSKLVIGDIWRARDLRDFTLLTSSNDGAFALAAVAESYIKDQSVDPRDQFIQMMNEEALKIGLLNSHFFNEHGLDRTADRGGPARTTEIVQSGGAYGSARDMATLFEYTIKNHPEVLETTRYDKLQFQSTSKTYSVKNTNTFTNQIPGLIASKTGFTDLAGGNLVIAFDLGVNRPIIVSILGSTEQGRFEDTLKLVEASLKYIKQN